MSDEEPHIKFLKSRGYDPTGESGRASGGSGALPALLLGIALAFVIYYFFGAFDNVGTTRNYLTRP